MYEYVVRDSDRVSDRRPTDRDRRKAACSHSFFVHVVMPPKEFCSVRGHVDPSVDQAFLRSERRSSFVLIPHSTFMANCRAAAGVAAGAALFSLRLNGDKRHRRVFSRRKLRRHFRKCFRLLHAQDIIAASAVGLPPLPPLFPLFPSSLSSQRGWLLHPESKIVR